MSVKILLDTDIGSDIDDSLCLAYLLSQKECEIVGITTVSGEAKKRAMMVSALCKKANKNVPIFTGIENPLLINPIQKVAQQADKLSNWEHDKEFEDFSAIDFMRKIIRENPNEIVLLAIGPLTNIALLFTIDPEIPSLLKELVLMCGAFTKKPDLPKAEWNAICDPHSAKIVYRSNVKRIRSIGLDVTMQLTMTKEEMDNNFTADILKPVIDFSGVWFERREEMVFHDPLAAAIIFDEDICSFEKGDVEVEIYNKELLGQTILEKGDSHNEVAVKVNKERFFKHYFNTINNKDIV